MSDKTLEQMVAEEQARPPRFYVAGDRIRKGLDPTKEHISDDEIAHILLICGGDVRRATHKCILAIKARAMRDKNGALVTWARERLRFHEAGLLIKP